jgi:membrane protease subunit HflC
MTRAQSVLDDIIDGTVRDMVNKNNLVEIIRSSDWSPDTMSHKGAAVAEPVKVGRDRISAMVHAAASKITPQYGIELVDVMFKRVNYIEKVRRKVYERMISERKRIAAEKRSLGEGRKAEILGRLDRELKEIMSGAERKAREIRGRADAEAARIYAEAYSRDPEFYAFMKSLDAYRAAVGENTRLVVSSDSGFYRYLESYRPGNPGRSSRR